MSRIYYCDKCKNTIEFKSNDNEICKCGYIFGSKVNDSTRDYHINMRNTWSNQTKLEFSTTTVGESIKKMKGE